MTETPRMVIVPAEMTEEVSLAIQDSVSSEDAWQGVIAASPNAGKVRRADLERAMEAADHAHSRWPGTPDQLDRIWQDTFADALGFQIAEGGADDR